MKRIFVFLFFFLLFFDNGFAEKESYQAELEMGYSYQKSDNTFHGRTNIVTAGLAYFFVPVNIATHPCLEADFLEKASSISINGMFKDYQSDSQMKMKMKTGTVNLEVFVPESRLFVGFLAEYSQTDYNYATLEKSTISKLQSSLGFMVDQGVLLTGFYFYQEANLTGAPGYIDYTVKYNGYGLMLKIVKEFGERALSMKLRGGNVKRTYSYAQEKVSMLNVDADLMFYPISFAGFGPTFSIKSGDDKMEEGTTLGFGVVGFFLPEFGIQMDYKKFNCSKYSYNDQEFYNISLHIRF